jgi:hypothetical protein
MGKSSGRRRVSWAAEAMLQPLTLVRAAPATGDQHQDILEHPSRHRDFGQLERDVDPMGRG